MRIRSRDSFPDLSRVGLVALISCLYWGASQTHQTHPGVLVADGFDDEGREEHHRMS